MLWHIHLYYTARTGVHVLQSDNLLVHQQWDLLQGHCSIHANKFL